MKTAFLSSLALLLVAPIQLLAEPPLTAESTKPATLMTTPGKLLLAEDFSAPLSPPEGSVARFASGFKGWRFNVEQRGGH